MINFEKMVKFKYLIVIFFIYNSNLYSQVTFEEHINSIKRVYSEGENMEGLFNANERAIEYATEFLLKDSIKTKYITNRRLLVEFENTGCKDSLSANFCKKLKNGTKINVEFKFKKFKADYRQVEKKDYATYIDGQIAFGSYSGLPSLEIEKLKITVNNRELEIPKSAYTNFYNTEPEPCDAKNYYYKSIEVYSSIDGSYIFIYLTGGNAADVYLAKLIFSKEQYLAQIVIDYKEIREWRVHRNKNFIGF